jgi:phosphatidylglycerophosphatase C
VPPAEPRTSRATNAPVIAAFDVDGTLTVRDCVVPFLRRTGGTLGMIAGLLRQPATVTSALARRDRDALKGAAARAAFGGRDVDEVTAAAVRFADVVAGEWLRPDTVARLAWHRDQGHEIVLVSASFELYLERVGARLEADAVLATRLEAVDGRFTGALAGPNCRGPEKVARLHQWLAVRHGGRDAVTVWAYGDSAGDRELLADADHPVWARDPISSVPTA